jgi:hypothetical protein
MVASSQTSKHDIENFFHSDNGPGIKNDPLLLSSRLTLLLLALATGTKKNSPSPVSPIPKENSGKFVVGVT